ncbi:MAG: hypothetical protein AAGE59_03085 [Cyanobacteria bacterium P01_F01_bin.86]
MQRESDGVLPPRHSLAITPSYHWAGDRSLLPRRVRANGNTDDICRLQPLHGPHPQAGFAHLPTVEDVAKLVRFEGSVEVAIASSDLPAKNAVKTSR